MMDYKKFSQEWEQLEIEGTLSEQTKSIELGAYCQNNGDFYFENFKLLIEDDNGNTEQFPLGNQGFEKKITADEFVPDWKQGESDGMAIRIKEFTLKTIYDDDKKSQVLMLKGEGIDSKPEAVGGEGLKGRTVEIEDQVDFSTQIKPILNNKCITCHGGVKKNAGFSLLFEEEAFADTKSGRPAIIRGDASGSEFIKRLHEDDLELRMPYEKAKLT
ncbi:hypothetical protein GQR58_028270 [Nymphon striatum]|nr:hypothetical protein GQR58_028270 [Nymphon striatum]